MAVPEIAPSVKDPMKMGSVSGSPAVSPINALLPHYLREYRKAVRQYMNDSFDNAFAGLLEARRKDLISEDTLKECTGLILAGFAENEVNTLVEDLFEFEIPNFQ